MKKLSAGLLLIVLLMPALSLRDDEVKLVNLLVKLNLHCDSLKTSDNGPKDHDRYRLNFPDYLEHLKLTAVTALHFDGSSSAVHSITRQISAQTPLPFAQAAHHLSSNRNFNSVVLI